jgi:hypothetical protein
LPKFYITDQALIEQRLSSLKKLRTSDDGWSDYYLDERTNEEWQLTRYHSEYHGGGIPILKRLPPPSVSELIEISLTSNDLNDVTGASIELCEREAYNDEEFRDELMQKLLLLDVATLSQFETKRLKTIIYESELFDSTNRKEILGKNWSEIKKDADFYRSISGKAKKILSELK